MRWEGICTLLGNRSATPRCDVALRAAVHGVRVSDDRVLYAALRHTLAKRVQNA
jgi:hypothetical protein